MVEFASPVSSLPSPFPDSVPPTTTNDLYAMWVAGDGDRTDLLLRMRKLLLQHAARVCWDVLHQENDHLIQEMVDDLLLELDKFNGKSKFSTYAHSRFRYRCIDEFRYQIRNLGDSLTESHVDWATDGVSETTAADVAGFKHYADQLNGSDPNTALSVSEYMDGLPVREREVVEARLEGHTFKEISSMTGIPQTTVKRIWEERVGGVRGSS
jgi:RNA polymerase sigma factor (sigma-70 family)